jgi:3-dehydroquinate synthase
MSDVFTIRSYRHQYRVEFVSNYAEELSLRLRAGDHLIIDKHVIGLHPSIHSCIKEFQTILIKPTERAKSYDALIPVIQELLDHRFTKKNRLVAIGGGIVQDITAFTASILFRGVDWLFFPTNLLTQCDSCIGSKTSINFGLFKNQIGGFYPPREVFIDLGFLDSLPEMEMRSGFGEMMHYFLVASEGDFRWAVERFDRAHRDRNVLRTMIHRSLAIKKAMIEEDEFDQGPRNVFNYGHSFGHALETTTHYSVPHGIAVSFGMDLANVISSHLGLIPLALRNRIRPTLAKVWAGMSLDEIDMNDFFMALAHDKKNEGKEIKVILTKGIGKMFKTTLVLDMEMKQLIEDYFREGQSNIDL